MHTRNWQADTNDKGIRTENNMSTSGGGTQYGINTHYVVDFPSISLEGKL